MTTSEPGGARVPAYPARLAEAEQRLRDAVMCLPGAAYVMAGLCGSQTTDHLTALIEAVRTNGAFRG